jgi:preprotein translocase subunit YajC
MLRQKNQQFLKNYLTNIKKNDSILTVGNILIKRVNKWKLLEIQ